MKSIEIIVPRKLIVGFYPHPELYGDFIVELKNGMITDVYYNEDNDFMTITSEEELIGYLNTQDIGETKFVYRNGVFALRQRNNTDKQRIDSWRVQKAIKCSEIISVELKNNLESLGIPQELIATFYWIEIGYIKLHQVEEGISFSFEVYEMEYFNNITKHNMLGKMDIEIFMDIIREYTTSKLPIK